MATDDDTNSALHHAAVGGHLEITEFLVSKASLDLEAPGKYGASTLLTAVYVGHLNLTKYLLLEARADAMARNNDYHN
eukprot:12427246-Karenia_brevis.AAC.1